MIESGWHIRSQLPIGEMMSPHIADQSQAAELMRDHMIKARPALLVLEPCHDQSKCRNRRADWQPTS